MNLIDKIKEDTLKAQKAQDARLLGVLRLLSSELSYKVIDSQAKMDDAVIVAVLQKEVKKRQEAIELYKKANSQGRVEQEEYEMKILSSYLPEMMSEEAVKQVIEETKQETGKTGGQLIGTVMGKLRGKADSAMVSRLIANHG